MIGARKRSEKDLAAESSLPANLRPHYRSLVEDYHFATAKRYGRGYISYGVLADLVAGGWRGPDPSGAAPAGGA